MLGEPMSPEFGRGHINYEAPKEPGGNPAITGETPEGQKFDDQRLFDFEKSEIREFEIGIEKISEGKEIVKNVEKVKENRTDLVDGMLQQNLAVLNLLLGQENPYPYESRNARYRIEGVLEEISKMHNKKIEGEGKAWLRTLDEEYGWGESVLCLAEGFAAGIPFYYSAIDKMKVELYTKPRKIPEAGDFENALRYIIPEGSEAEHAKDKELLKPHFNDGEGKEARNAKEIGVDYISRSEFWQSSVAAIGQIEIPKKGQFDFPEKISMMNSSALSVGHMYIIEKLFAYQPKNKTGQNLPIKRIDLIDQTILGKDPFEGKENITYEEILRGIPKDLMNYYSMSETDKKKKIYMATIMALAKLNVKEEIDKLEIGTGVYGKISLDEIVANVENERKRILKGWTKREKSLDDKLAELATKLIIIKNLGTLGAVKLSWKFSYEEKKDDNGRGIGSINLNTSFVSNGSTNTAGDGYTPYYWFWHDLSYGVQAKKASELLVPLGDGYRRLNLRRSPFARPETTLDSRTEGFDPEDPDKNQSLENMRKNDPVIDEAFHRILDDTPDAIAWRNKLAKRYNLETIEISKFLKPLLKQMVWFWETPWLSNSNKIDKHMTLPIFLPPYMSSQNFFDVLRPEKVDENDAGKAAKKQKRLNGQFKAYDFPQPSIQDLLDSGRELKTIDFTNEKGQGFDWYLVNMQMTSRWFAYLIDPVNPDRDENYWKFFLNPGCLTELIKRVDLGHRGQNYVDVFGVGKVDLAESDNKAVMEVLAVPMLVALALAKNNKIFTEEFIKLETRTRWKKDVAKWINMSFYLPQQKSIGMEKYNQSMGLMVWFYSFLLNRMAKEWSLQEKDDSDEVEKDMITGIFD